MGSQEVFPLWKITLGHLRIASYKNCGPNIDKLSQRYCQGSGLCIVYIVNQHQPGGHKGMEQCFYMTGWVKGSIMTKLCRKCSKSRKENNKKLKQRAATPDSWAFLLTSWTCSAGSQLHFDLYNLYFSVLFHFIPFILYFFSH